MYYIFVDGVKKRTSRKKSVLSWEVCIVRGSYKERSKGKISTFPGEVVKEKHATYDIELIFHSMSVDSIIVP